MNAIRQLLVLLWGASIASSIVATFLFVGSLNPEHSSLFVFVALPSLIYFVAGMIVMELQDKAFDRGFKAAEDEATRAKEMDPK